MIDDAQLAKGARNLLVNCAGLKTGQRLLIVHESPDLGWYDCQAPMAVAAEARRLGADPVMLEVGEPGNDHDPRVARAISAHDVIVFFARIGDQDRFSDPVPGKTCVMSYVRDAEMLASAYGATNHLALMDLKEAVNAILLGANRIDISCPLGTKISGVPPKSAGPARADVSVRRFPLGVPQPVGAAHFSGRVALARYLTPTGSKVYRPASLEIEDPIFAEVASGRIAGFSGNQDTARRVREHYRRISTLFDIDAGAVHSWHAGIHPGCVYTADAAHDPDRWSNTVFTNPRFLHFHTCGDYPPGEICWMVLDPTVVIDGQALWEDGRLRPAAFPQTRRCLKTWPDLGPVFAAPSDRIGLAV